MLKPKVTINPKHPERICWGCDKYCSADDLRCGNGTIRTQHPVELFGEDWVEWELNTGAQSMSDIASRNEKGELADLQNSERNSLRHRRELLGLGISAKDVG